MANNPGSVPPSQPPSIEKRLPIALALMMLVLLISQYLFKPAPGPKPVAPVNEKAAAQLTEKPAPAPVAAAAPSIPRTANQAARIQAPFEVTSTIDTALYQIVFTNRGAAVKSWVLKQYQDESGKPLQLINLDAKDLPLPFTIEVTGQKLAFDPNTVLYQSRRSPNGTGIVFEFSDGGTTIRKSFDFTNQSYLAQIKSVVLQNNTPVPHLLMWRGGFGDQKVRNAYTTEHTVRYDTERRKADHQDHQGREERPRY